MSFDYQPVLQGDIVELRPLRAEDFDELYAVAADPLIWEQHPVSNRHEEATFRAFFEEALTSGGTLTAIDASSRRIIGSSRFHGYVEERREVEIGWTFLARSHWSGKYNGEMKRLMLQHAFRFVSAVIFLVGLQNVRSQRAVEKSAVFASGHGQMRAAETAMCTRSLPRRFDCGAVCEGTDVANIQLGPNRVADHSLATHLLESGCDIRTIQGLPGQRDVGATMVYTHVRNRGGRGVRGPSRVERSRIRRRVPAGVRRIDRPAHPAEGPVIDCRNLLGLCRFRRFDRLLGGC